MSRAAPVLRAAFSLVVVVALVVSPAPRARAQLFENLKALGNRLKVSSLQGGVLDWGPKGIATADFDDDSRPDLATCNVDGSVSIYFGEGDGRFSPELLLATESYTLRDILVADLNRDDRPDIAVTDPFGGRLVIFDNTGGRSFAAARIVSTWAHARNLEAGDFDGDGITDLAIAGNGLGLQEYRGTPSGDFVPGVFVPELNYPSLDFKPVYSLDAFRVTGATRDSILATHAEYAGFHLLDRGAGEGLSLQATYTGEAHIHYLRAGKLLRPETEPGPVDLVLVRKKLDRIEVRQGAENPTSFESIRQVFSIPLGPRSVEILDLDGDGWNDLVVPVRYLDRVLTFRNDRGTFVAAHEMPVGSSPRESASADFNGDGAPDLAVINRHSRDISVLPGHPGTPGFSILDQVYLVDGDVAVLDLSDLDSDGKQDVIQLHQAAGDVSTRLAGPEGRLGSPRFHSMGTNPHSLALIDMDGDGDIDLVTASVDFSSPTLSFRLGDGTGEFGPLTTVQFSSRYPGGYLIGILAADYDRDGDVDLAIGIYDCSGSHIVFFENGGGTYTEVNSFGFRYAASLATADFDADGDLDLAAVSGLGELAVIESAGSLLRAQDLKTVIYTEMQEHHVGGRDMTVADLNADGDPEILATASTGYIVYRGAPGMAFIPEPHFTGSIESPVSDSASADLDADGDQDLAMACRIAACVSILTQGADMEYSLALSVDVPSARHLAAGDVDGDGFADLVGSGDALWTALSSRRSRMGPPPVLEDHRERVASVVINEVLAMNEDLPIAEDDGKKADWVEIFNGTGGAAALGGWTLILEDLAGGGGVFTFPPAELASGTHRLVIFSPSVRSEYHTGFRLPAEGGRLVLRNPAGEVVDQVVYGLQFEDVSYARYADALPGFTFNTSPTPGSPNAYPGPMPPQFELLSMSPAAPVAREPVEFLGKGRDDVGIESVTLIYRLAGGASPPERVELQDISFGVEAETGERTFFARLEAGLPAGLVELYFEVTDRSGNQATVPEDGAGLDDGGGAFKVLVGDAGVPLPQVEISEVVPLNETGLEDGHDGRPDWIEVRNCSFAPVSMSGVYLARTFPHEDIDDWYAFPEGDLLPGAHYIVFCDGDTEQGQDHAPFTLDAEGDRVVLLWRSEAHQGAVLAIDEAAFGSVGADLAFARAQCGGPWSVGTPTPGKSGPGNSVVRGDVDASGVLDITDPINILGRLFLGARIDCPRATDVNGDLRENITDAIHLLLFLFQGGPAPMGDPVPVAECLVE